MIHYEILMQPHFYSSIIGDYGSRHFLAICYATSTYLLFRISSPFLVHIYNAMLPTSFCIQRSLFRKKSRLMSLSKVHWFFSYLLHISFMILSNSLAMMTYFFLTRREQHLNSLACHLLLLFELWGVVAKLSI